MGGGGVASHQAYYGMSGPLGRGRGGGWIEGGRKEGISHSGLFIFFSLHLGVIEDSHVRE